MFDNFVKLFPKVPDIPNIPTVPGIPTNLPGTQGTTTKATDETRNSENKNGSDQPSSTENKSTLPNFVPGAPAFPKFGGLSQFSIPSWSKVPGVGGLNLDLVNPSQTKKTEESTEISASKQNGEQCTTEDTEIPTQVNGSEKEGENTQNDQPNSVATKEPTSNEINAPSEPIYERVGGPGQSETIGSNVGENQDLQNENTPGIERIRTESFDQLTIEGRGNCFVFRAKTEYNPKTMSPSSNPEGELAFEEGDYILVWSLDEEDGFVPGELLNGRGGLVPSTFLRQIVAQELVEFFHSYSHGSLDILPSNQFGCLIDDGFYLDIPGAAVPLDLVIERRFGKSWLVSWKPPSVQPEVVHYYKVYLNGIHQRTTQPTDGTRTILQALEDNKACRVSVRSVSTHGQMSKDVGCTMVVGQNPPLSPIAVRVMKITANSAILCWFPSTCEARHSIFLNNKKIKTTQPKVFHDILEGLTPNTSYLVMVYTEDVTTPPHLATTQEKMDALSIQTLFQTALKDLRPPQKVQIGKGPLPNKIRVTWEPVLEKGTTTYKNFCVQDTVTGYAIFVNGSKIWEIDDPSGDHALLDLNNPYFRTGPTVNVTVRTKYGDTFSIDSHPVCPSHPVNNSSKIPQGSDRHFSHAEFFGTKPTAPRFLPDRPPQIVNATVTPASPNLIAHNKPPGNCLKPGTQKTMSPVQVQSVSANLGAKPVELEKPQEIVRQTPSGGPAEGHVLPESGLSGVYQSQTKVSKIEHSTRELPDPSASQEVVPPNKQEEFEHPETNLEDMDEKALEDELALLTAATGKPVLSNRWAYLLDPLVPRQKRPPPVKKKGAVTGERPPRALFCLTLSNPIRRFCINVSEMKAFEYLILVTIICTCFSLAMSTPYPNDDSDPLNDRLESMEGLFGFIFTTECFMKVVAYGLLLHPGSYLRNTWNFLDFTIVMIGVISGVLAMVEVEGFDAKALRAFRVLRPLRLVSGVPSLQIIMNSILKSIMSLFQIALLVIFVIIIYSIIGLELFSGAMHSTCRDKVTGKIMDSPVPCGGDYQCTNPNHECVYGWEGPYYGIINFDNFGLAMITVFQCITMEGWTQTLYNINDAMGGGWQWIYFTSMVVLGAFFVMNLILGVLTGEFSKEGERIKGRMDALRLRNDRLEEDAFQNYLNWIIKAEDIICEEEGLTRGDLKPKVVVEEVRLKRKSWLQKNHPNGAVINKKFRALLTRMCKSQPFFWFILILVFLNTCIFATEYHGQPPWLDEFQANGNKLFVALFTCEGLLKMYCMGLNRYFRSLFNRFDTFVVLSSITEMYLISAELMPPIGLSVLRCTRLLRVFKVTKHWSSLTSLVASLIASIGSIISLIVLLFLFIVIFALLGMQVFGGKFNFDSRSDKPRQTFDSFPQAMLTVFQILTGEDWNEVMYSGILSFGGVNSIGIVASIYFIILFISGNYILLNVFLAIAVDSLGDGSDVEKDEEEPPEKEKGGGDEDEGGGSGEPRQPIPNASSFFIFSTTNGVRVGCYELIHNGAYGNFILICILISSASLGAEDPIYEKSPRNLVLNKMDVFFTTIFLLEIIFKLIVFGLLFHKGAFCRSFANLLDIIVVSTSFVPSEGAFAQIKILRIARVLRPLRAVKRLPGLQRVVQCTIVSIQTIGNIVVVTALLQFMFAVMGVQLFKGKLYSCTDPSKITPEECRGYFIKYKDGDLSRPILERRLWENNNFNFDSVGKAMLTLFAVSTFEGWPQMLYLSIDSWAEDHGPSYNFRKIVAVYYIVYLIIIALFLVNIFVGFVIITFQNEGEKEFESCPLDKNQRNCVAFAMTAKCAQSYIPEKEWQSRIWSVVTASWFENSINGLILMNTVTMTMKFHEQPLAFTDLMGKINIVFSVLFGIECFMKLAAMGAKNFFRDPWNTFDFVLVWGSVIDIGISFFEEPEQEGVPKEQGFNIIKFLRLFRVARLVKLLNRNEGMRTLLWTFMRSLQALPYVVMLIVLLFFIYAVVGMQMFGKIKLDSETEIHRNNNFQSFAAATLLLFRCATGEAWQDIMMSCVNKPAVKCQEVMDEHGNLIPPELDPNTGLPVTCGGDFAFVYFVSFFFVCSFVILNLFVAVIMDNFDYLVRDWSILGAHHLGAFIDMWSENDPEASGKLSHERFVTMMKRLSPPLGWGPLCPTRTVCKRMISMNMPLADDGTVQFSYTLMAVIRSNLQIKMEGDMIEANEELKELIRGIWKNPDEGVLNDLIPSEAVLHTTVGKVYAAIMFQDAWRRRVRMKALRQELLKRRKLAEAEVLKQQKSHVTKTKVKLQADLSFDKGDGEHLYAHIVDGNVVTGKELDGKIGGTPV